MLKCRIARVHTQNIILQKGLISQSIKVALCRCYIRTADISELIEHL